MVEHSHIWRAVHVPRPKTKQTEPFWGAQKAKSGLTPLIVELDGRKVPVSSQHSDIGKYDRTASIQANTSLKRLGGSHIFEGKAFHENRVIKEQLKQGWRLAALEAANALKWGWTRPKQDVMAAERREAFLTGAMQAGASQKEAHDLAEREYGQSGLTEKKKKTKRKDPFCAKTLLDLAVWLDILTDEERKDVPEWTELLTLKDFINFVVSLLFVTILLVVNSTSKVRSLFVDQYWY